MSETTNLIFNILHMEAHIQCVMLILSHSFLLMDKASFLLYCNGCLTCGVAIKCETYVTYNGCT